MRKNILKNLMSLAVMMMWSVASYSQTETPTFHVHNFADGAILQGMSDNGAYAVAYGKNPANDTWSSYPRIVNLATDEVISLLSEDEVATTTSVSVRDITDDGSIAVGTYNCLPGIWRQSTGKWETLPVPEPPAGETWCDGYVAAVTPDGKYAVGTLSYKNLFGEQPVMWSLEGDAEIIETPNCPMEGMSGINQEQSRFIGITPDGAKILGCVSYSYPGDTFYFLYERATETHEVIGYDKSGGVFIPKYDNQLFTNNAVLSPNGKYVAGTLYIAEPIEGSEFFNEYTVVYRYDIETAEFDAFDTVDDKTMIIPAVGNDGTLYGSTPSGSPVRTWAARVGNYWYTFDQVLQQVYGFNFTDKTGFENSGTMVAVDNAGTRFVSFPYPIGESYVVDLPTTMPELTAGIDLLGEYSVSPASGTSFSKLGNIELTFSRDVDVVADKADIELRDGNGNVVKTAIKFALKAASAKTVEIGFRTLELEAGVEYSVVIPAGAVNVAGDATKKNNEIVIKYLGRENAPVKMTSVSPESGSTLARINLTTNPVVVTFDATLTLGENPSARLMLVGDDESEEAVADMYLAVAGNQALVYPLNEQRLYLGSTYKIIIDANSLYDLTGENGNEEFEITYIGSYEREIIAEGNVLFEESFDDYNVGLGNMMLYEGDHLTPTSELSAWGFDADNTPWWLTRSSEDDMNNAATSHSCYTNGGKSDDWMVIPQLFIPDETCRLSFDSQNYRASKQDKLSVYVWATDEVYNTLTSSVINDFRKNAVQLFAGIQTPGANEETLDGDWTENSLDLAEFTGKNIYIAFVNENENQSAIFVDNVKVTRSVDFVVSLDHETTVAALESAEIKGRIRVESDTETFTSVALTLLDEQGNTIDAFSESGLNLVKGDIYNFAFSNKLPLQPGKVANFSVIAKMNEVEESVKGTIKNLHFVPVKRVVLEEGTGQGCQNCPLGHQMIELLHETYGDKFISIAIHTYTGDIYGTGMSGYTSFLGISAYPSAMINRSGRITSPMESYYDEEGGVHYRYTNPENPLWWDDVAAEFETYADADISIVGGAQFDKEAGTIRVPLEVRYALDMENVNVNLFGVVLENGLTGYQQNAYSQMSDAIFGEWGQGGIYGQSTVVPFTFNEVARGVYGLTYNGNGGHVPSEVVSGQKYATEINMEIPATVRNIENCDIVVMMIDANTGKVVNAVKGQIFDVLSVDEVADKDVKISVENDRVIVDASSEAQVQVYAADGRLLAQTQGNGLLELSVGDYSGVAIIRTIIGNDVNVEKIIF